MWENVEKKILSKQSFFCVYLPDNIVHRIKLASEVDCFRTLLQTKGCILVETQFVEIFSISLTRIITLQCVRHEGHEAWQRTRQIVST